MTTIIGLLEVIKVWIPTGLPISKTQKIKNKTKKTFQSQGDDTRSLYGWMVKVRSDWAWLVHRRVPRDQLALFVVEKRGRFLNVGNNFWKGITKAEEEGEEKMVRWKEKERKEGEPHQQCRLLVYLLPFLTLQLLLKTPTHTHTLPHTHHTHVRMKVEEEGGGRGERRKGIYR
jgi:hypothetical protein